VFSHLTFCYSILRKVISTAFLLIFINSILFLLKMKLNSTIFSLLLVGSSSFAPIPLRRISAATQISSEPSDDADGEGGLDLDLGEMFDMFDAAEKGEDFDKAMTDVKKGED